MTGCSVPDIVLRAFYLLLLLNLLTALLGKTIIIFVLEMRRQRPREIKCLVQSNMEAEPQFRLWSAPEPVLSLFVYFFFFSNNFKYTKNCQKRKEKEKVYKEQPYMLRFAC